MVEKKEGATMDCLNCGTELICRKKEYSGNFASTLQWQNNDGTAHYKTTDGKNFECNIPEEEEEQQDPTQKKLPVTESPILYRLEESLIEINKKLDSIFEIIDAIARASINEQLRKK